MIQVSNTPSVPRDLNMGIHCDEGVVCLPKQFEPDRNKAKVWALDNGFADTYIDTRIRTVWMVEDDAAFEPGWYVKCLPEVGGAFECWEIRS